MITFVPLIYTERNVAKDGNRKTKNLCHHIAP